MINSMQVDVETYGGLSDIDYIDNDYTSRDMREGTSEKNA